MLPKDWAGKPGHMFRKGTKSISDFAAEQNLSGEDVARDSIRLTRTKLEGAAHVELARAEKEFAQAEGIRIKNEISRRAVDAKVRKLEAEANKAETDQLLNLLALVDKLKSAGIILVQDDRGNIHLKGASSEFDWSQLTSRIARALSEDSSNPPRDLGGAAYEGAVDILNRWYPLLREPQSVSPSELLQQMSARGEMVLQYGHKCDVCGEAAVYEFNLGPPSGAGLTRDSKMWRCREHSYVRGA